MDMALSKFEKAKQTTAKRGTWAQIHFRDGEERQEEAAQAGAGIALISRVFTIMYTEYTVGKKGMHKYLCLRKDGFGNRDCCSTFKHTVSSLRYIGS